MPRDWIQRHENLGDGFEAYVVEAASHEFGHNLGLAHDGTGGVGGTSYYSGHGSGLISWAPIMGVGYDQNVTQWSKGEYANAQSYDLGQPAVRAGRERDCDDGHDRSG